jgi:hypothetical protein
MQVHQRDMGDIIKYLAEPEPFDRRSFETNRCRLFI